VDQPVCDVLADAVTALNSPHPVSEPASGYQHFRITRAIGAEFANHDHLAEIVDHLDRG
jgi:hypothetical protein